MKKTLAVGFAGVSLGSSALSFNIDNNTIEIPKPMLDETYYIGYTNDYGKTFACYFKINKISEVETIPTIEITVSIKDHETLEELKSYSLKLATSWHTFDEIKLMR